MSRTFQDEDFRVWEVYPSGNRFGYSENPALIFHCLTDRSLRPRHITFDGDESDAERAVGDASVDRLIALLGQAAELR